MYCPHTAGSLEAFWSEERREKQNTLGVNFHYKTKYMVVTLILGGNILLLLPLSSMGCPPLDPPFLERERRERERENLGVGPLFLYLCVYVTGHGNLGRG